MFLPNITHVTVTGYSTYLNLDVDGVQIAVVQRNDGSTEAYTYVKGIRLEVPAWVLPTNLLSLNLV